jgi:hypothetical protein
MSSYSYLDGNAAAGELSRVFNIDITSAEGQCASCGAKRRFAEAHLYAVSRPRRAVCRVRGRAPSSCEC